MAREDASDAKIHIIFCHSVPYQVCFGPAQITFRKNNILLLIIFSLVSFFRQLLYLEILELHLFLIFDSYKIQFAKFCELAKIFITLGDSALSGTTLS